MVNSRTKRKIELQEENGSNWAEKALEAREQRPPASETPWLY